MYRQSETRAENQRRHTRTRNASLPTQGNNTARGARKQPPNQGTVHAASEDATHSSHHTLCHHLGQRSRLESAVHSDLLHHELRPIVSSAAVPFTGAAADWHVGAIARRDGYCGNQPQSPLWGAFCSDTACRILLQRAALHMHCVIWTRMPAVSMHIMTATELCGAVLEYPLPS